MILPHLPALRRGQPYESLDKNDVIDHRTGEVRAQWITAQLKTQEEGRFTEETDENFIRQAPQLPEQACYQLAARPSHSISGLP